jgi:TPR repeat protein
MRSACLLALLFVSPLARGQGLEGREPDLWRRAAAKDQAALEALALKAEGDADVHLLGRLALRLPYKPMVRSGASALLSRMKAGFDPLATPGSAAEDLVMLEILSATSPESRAAEMHLLARIEALPTEAGGAILQQAQALGSKEARGEWGLRLIQGRGTPSDSDRGFRLVMDSGSLRAAVDAGEKLEAKDPDKARKAFLSAREAEDPILAFRAGRGLERLAKALAEPSLDAKAKQAYLTAAEGKVGAAAAALARFEAEGRGGSGNAYPKARQWAEKALAYGDPEGHYWLGWLDAMGHDGPRNLASALDHFRKGSEAGNAACTYRLGLAYREGEGVPADAAQAQVWFTRAADQGHPESSFALAKILLADGQAEAALGRLRTAAEGGLVKAQVQLAACLTEGLGGPEDLASARRWLEKAAAHHDGEAYYRLAMMDLDELRTKAQAEAVLERLRLAAAEGHPESAELLRLWRP